MESSTVVEEETVVAEVVEASRKTTEVAATELTAEPTTGEVPGSEAPAAELGAKAAAREAATPDVPAANRSTESPGAPASETAGVAAYETATTNVSTACAGATVPPSSGERDAAVQGERQYDGEAKGEKVTTEPRQRPMNRRELHDASLVASSGLVKGGLPGLTRLREAD